MFYELFLILTGVYIEQNYALPSIYENIMIFKAKHNKHNKDNYSDGYFYMFIDYIKKK